MKNIQISDEVDKVLTRLSHETGDYDSVIYDYPHTEIIYQDTIQSGNPSRFVFSLPQDIRTGYMRMRVMVDQNSTGPTDPTETAGQFGCIHDYLLYIEDVPVDVDVCASRIVAPREQHIGGHTG